MEPLIINITGNKIALGPLRRDLIPLYQRWINDFGASRNLGDIAPRILEHETAWFDRATQRDSEVAFTIYERAILPEGLPRPIGTTGPSDITFGNGRAEFGILIGELDARGIGYGTETTRLVLDYAF